MVICVERDADLHMAQLMPLALTVSCFSKIQIGFIFLVPAHPGSPGKRAVKRVCVCVVYKIIQWENQMMEHLADFNALRFSRPGDDAWDSKSHVAWVDEIRRFQHQRQTVQVTQHRHLHLHNSQPSSLSVSSVRVRLVLRLRSTSATDCAGNSASTPSPTQQPAFQPQCQ